jgi:hypothetical protein
MQQHYASIQPTTNQLPVSATADRHHVADKTVVFQSPNGYDPGATFGGSGTSNTAASARGPHLKQLPTHFQWDFKTSTSTESSGGRTINQAGVSSPTKAPRPKTSLTTKESRITTPTARTQPTAAAVATTPLTASADEETPTPAASRIPKIYDNNPKIDPFTEPPALVPAVNTNLHFSSSGSVILFTRYKNLCHI